MATQSINGNVVYIVSLSDARRVPVRRSVLDAVQKFVDGKLTGSITLSFKSGGIASVEDRTVYQDGQ